MSMEITWKNKERSDLGKISNLRTRIVSLLVKTWSFCADEAKISNKAREKKFQENIPSRIDPYKKRLDPYLSVTASSRFSEYVYIDNCTKTRSLPCKDRSLWDRMRLKFKIVIFLCIVKRPKLVFGPKRIFFSKSWLKIGCQLGLV